jgi:hypothetical protein
MTADRLVWWHLTRVGPVESNGLVPADDMASGAAVPGWTVDDDGMQVFVGLIPADAEHPGQEIRRVAREAIDGDSPMGEALITTVSVRLGAALRLAGVRQVGDFLALTTDGRRASTPTGRIIRGIGARSAAEIRAAQQEIRWAMAHPGADYWATCQGRRPPSRGCRWPWCTCTPSGGA